VRVAVLGSGAREHALQWHLAKSPHAEIVFAMPGNGGTPNRIPVDVRDTDAILSACESERIDLLVVGPEAPLADGIVEAFAGRSTLVFGPNRTAAQMEGSKVWSKAFMLRHGIPTAQHRIVASLDELSTFFGEHDGVVIKADGLAAGKGVSVCRERTDLPPEWERIQAFRGAGEPVLAEEILDGWELSIHVLTDGETYCLFPTSQDHKPLLDGDRGPNTGGMGAFGPVSACDGKLLACIRSEIIEPTLRGLTADSILYRGFLYFGLMITDHGPRVLEYNVRLGDPEAQVLLPALEADLLPALTGCLDSRLQPDALAFTSDVHVTVVLASPGYPTAPETGRIIEGVDELDPSHLVFHAGTARRDDRLVTSGGRVLSAVGRGITLDDALTAAYETCSRIRFDGMQYRTDIGRRNQP